MEGDWHCVSTTSIEGSCLGYVSGFVKFGLGCLHRGVVLGIFRVHVNSNKALSLICSLSAT